MSGAEPPGGGPETPHVLARRRGALGHITLDRPAAYNALSLGMVRAIDAALDAWEHDPAIAAILLDGAGERAFCAGGDIRALYEAARAGHHDDLVAFFRGEYRLNARIARFGKPIVAAMHGVTMGGGIGLGAHASHRLVATGAVLAMPEVKIGFVPDVGGTYLLARAPGRTGLHLALTGGRLDASDALFCGLADHHVTLSAIEAARDALPRCRDRAEVSACVAALASPPGPSRLAEAQRWIDPCYGAGSVEEIVDALGRSPEADARAAADEIAGNAPVSLAVTFDAVTQARDLDLEDCLEREFRVSCSITREPDFVEGVRAVVVDKSRDARWRPGRLEDVSRADVLRHARDAREGGLGLRP